MKSIVQFSIKQTVLFNVVFIILVVAGAFAIFTTPLENMPVVDMGNVFINTVYYGASADDVEQLVTVEIEKALDGLEDVEYIKSDSYRNFSSVEVKFLDDSDYRFRYDELGFRVLNIKDELPPDADESTFMYLDTNVWLPVVIVNITGDMSQRSLERYADELRTSLLTIPNVRDAEIEGEYDTELHVSLDPAKLRRFGITFQQAVDAMRSANTKISTGRFRTRESEYMLDAGDRLNSQEEILNTVVRRDGDGNFVRVRNLVTNARLSHRDPSVIPSVNGQSTVRLPVTKEIKGNAIEISAAVKKVAREFEARHARDGIQVIFTNDSTIEINDSLNTLGGNLLLGMGLVTLVLWGTLGFRNAMLTAIGIPFAFLGSVLMMQLTGVSLNTISLFAFVLVTDIMVDDAVIIVENIYRHFQMGKSRKTAVIDGTAEVMLPVIASALTTILAFIPMLLMTGSTGDFFSYIPKTVTYALLASLLEALLILPIHFLEWGPKDSSQAARKPRQHDSEDAFPHLEGGLFAPFWKAYRWSVVKILNHKTFKFVPQQEAVFEFGLQPAVVTRMVAGTLNGQYVGKFRTIEEEVDLLVRIARLADKGNINGTSLAEPLDILGIPVVEDSTSSILLRDLIEVKPVFEPDVKSRYKGKPTITLTSDIKPGSRLSPARVQVLVNNYVTSNADDFSGITFAYGGEFESTSKSYASLTMAFFIALLAIYMVLASQFKDYVRSLIIISSVPMATAFVSGLISATVLTLLITPANYEAFEQLKSYLITNNG